ncbi:hypothetical protein [Agromyces sp. NBRC 114283]|uniref:hypothetical protein n=1 Tax=Agromyces sp. NBRC 114283 TaxID=2994521 RepID=UPI0024A2104D|nr:hypothetical protein [Agromyces sp. NBRC 114283]GLU91345.1 hypothetical protein Agsp01_36000 [Agromyces sp. NBRC 114283]
MIRITHPRPHAGRQRFLGVEFVDGTAEVADLHPAREQALLQHGAAIELEGVPLEDLSARELRELAVDEGIDVPKKANKAQIIALITAAPVRTLAAEFDLASQSRREFDDAPEKGQV